MKGLALFALFGIGAIAIWKHHVQATATVKAPGSDLPSGVSVYPNAPAPQQGQQILAALATNPDAVSDLGFSPAFGWDENQPGTGEELW